MDRTAKITKALTLLWESASAADGDFCGEQRAWHLPRISKAAAMLAEIHPAETVWAMQAAKTPYGDPVLGEETEHTSGDPGPR